MRCLYCKNQLKLFEQYCPSCGKKVFDDEPAIVPVVRPKKVKQRKESRLLISDFDAVLMGLYKDDKEYEDYLKTCIMLGIDE